MSITVLIVDDEPSARLLVSDILSDDYDVVEAQDAKQAMEMFATHNPDIVLSDIKMPGEDGVALLGKIKSVSPKTPVILLTGHGDKVLAVEALKKGAFDFIEKPFEDEEIVSATQRAAHGLRLEAELVNVQARSVESEKLASLGVMAGGVAHEINTPLWAILLSSNSLKKHAQGGELNPEYIIKISDNIGRVVEHISKIITSLKTFSRDSGQDPFLDTKVFTLLEGVISLCAKRFSSGSIELKVEGPSDPSLSLQCRESELAQVIFNLLNNAHDAVEHLDERWVKVEVLDLGENVQIKVSDSGPGIPAEVRSQIFEPFFTTKDVGKGTGLGLSVSIGIIRAHSGKIAIDLESPNTVFVVTLPKIQCMIEEAA